MAKFIVVIVLLVAVGSAWWYLEHKKEQDRMLLEKRALATAQLWIGAAQLGDKEAKFVAFRDSLLAANGISREEMNDYLEKYESEPEDYFDFTGLVGTYVDSLVKIEKKRISDSLAVLDSLRAEPADSN